VPSSPPRPLRDALRRGGSVFLGVALLCGAAWILRREVAAVRWDDVRAGMAALPSSSILLAAVFAACNYLSLTGYELLGLAWLGRKLPRSKVMAASFSGYALSHGLGFPLLTGTAVRYRLYSRWGVPAREFARLVLFYSGSFWLGVTAWTGISLVFFPLPALGDTLRNYGHAAGGALLAAVAAYTALGAVARGPIRLRKFSFSPIPPRITLPQVALSLVDWALAAAALHALLPADSNPGYPAVLAAFAAAQTLGMISHVPGGVGVFEGTMLFLLGHSAAGNPALLSALLLFRCVYFLFPMTLVPLVLGAVKLKSSTPRRGSRSAST
jgi:phosphatidylglycerol lysyltransferase